MARYSRNDQAGIELPKAKLNRESLRQATGLFGYLRPYRGRFGAALASLFVGTLLSLAFPYFAGSIIDAALHHPNGPGSMGAQIEPHSCFWVSWRCRRAVPFSRRSRLPRWGSAAWSICAAILTRA